MSLAERIRYIRESSGLSASAFAKNLGYPQRTYASYEKGDRTPSLDFLNELANRYNVNLHWLLTGFGITIFPVDYLDRLELEEKINNKNTFGKRLSYLISMKNEEISEVAKKIKLNESKIEKLIIDEEKPTLETLVKLSQIYSVSIDSLLGLSKDYALPQQLLGTHAMQLLAKGYTIEDTAVMLGLNEVQLSEIIAKLLLGNKKYH